MCRWKMNKNLFAGKVRTFGIYITTNANQESMYHPEDVYVFYIIFLPLSLPSFFKHHYTVNYTIPTYQRKFTMSHPGIGQWKSVQPPWSSSNWLSSWGRRNSCLSFLAPSMLSSAEWVKLMRHEILPFAFHSTIQFSIQDKKAYALAKITAIHTFYGFVLCSLLTG